MSNWKLVRERRLLRQSNCPANTLYATAPGKKIVGMYLFAISGQDYHDLAE